jgi:hypothetical protein
MLPEEQAEASRIWRDPEALMRLFKEILRKGGNCR